MFGAFSAGKSSFANALLGEEVLKVSPNPTTATVNIIEKSTEDNPHRTALISIKSETALNNEVRSVGQQLDVDLDICRLKEWSPKWDQFITNIQKTYAEYLLTLKESLATNDWQLGNSFSVPVSEVEKYAAKESNACLVEKITIYYDCPLTEKGIVLVDTPGVNSIHGRHTNVAFQQLRQSDAIFYLTYYNHAFSKADQYFLQQLGKVNESFKYDKLYFVINAADLAESYGELNGVRKHVHDQLEHNGIMKPRLYHLSSKEGLLNKKKGNLEETSFTQFESTFYNASIIELKELSIKLISHQLGHYVDKLRDSLQLMDEEKAEKERKHTVLKEIVHKEQQTIKDSTFSHARRDIFQELDQLELYLKDRMRFVLNDYYSTAINVAVLTGNTKKELHRQLTGAIGDWKRLGEQFLKQELEGTLIRVEEKIKFRSNKWMDGEIKRIQEKLPHIHQEATTDFQGPQVDYDASIIIQPSNYLLFLNNKKDFFENGKWKELKETLVTDGTTSASIAIERETNKLKEKLAIKLEEIEFQAKNQLVDAIWTELERFEVLLMGREKESLANELDELKKLTL
ncbi:MAG: dynamin family protein [Bacillus sp. (in: Bacteria)]|nr:dynamin family protein [Bacillus sp. (in: firmicutes)]